MATREVTINKVKYTLHFDPRFVDHKGYVDRVKPHLNIKQSDDRLKSMLDDMVFISLTTIDKDGETEVSYPDVAGLSTHEATQKLKQNILRKGYKGVDEFLEDVFGDGLTADIPPVVEVKTPVVEPAPTSEPDETPETE